MARRSGLPKRPSDPTPPPRLLEISQQLLHPEVAQTGLTTTSDGRWALMVRLQPGAHAPLDEVERLTGEFPVVYRPPRARTPIARPAYPQLGE